MMKYKEIYDAAVSSLKAADVPEAGLDARLLLEYVCDTDRNTLLAHPERPVSEAEQLRFEKLINKRAMRIPLQHLIGSCEFMGLDFTVSEDVLVPRQDTECLVEEAMRYIEDGMAVLDMCTGSGCILISLMKYKNDLIGVGCDMSEAALNIAVRNADRLGVDAVFLRGNMFEALREKQEIPKKFDVIVSNPPYIRSDAIPTLMEEVRDHEPHMALDGGEDGLGFYRIIADEAKPYLTNYGRVFMEIGYDQKEEVMQLMKNAGYSNVEAYEDYAGNPRVVQASWINHDL